jgi:hypothetical protein
MKQDLQDLMVFEKIAQPDGAAGDWLLKTDD